jgi:hypothetical protein
MFLPRLSLMILCFTGGSAWIATRKSLFRQTFARGLSTRTNQEQGITEDIPCWQDIYDDDCSMTNMAAAHFVASEWIKSLPCAQGLEDCDMPRDLTVPETRPEAGVDHVDVMAFLGLNRAVSLNKMGKNEGRTMP